MFFNALLNGKRTKNNAEIKNGVIEANSCELKAKINVTKERIEDLRVRIRVNNKKVVAPSTCTPPAK